MSKRRQDVQLFPLPPPIGGINVRDPAIRLAATDAASIINWYPLQSSLLARGAETTARDISGTENIKGFFNWVNAYDVDICVLTSDTKIYSLADPAASFTATDITGAVTMSDGACSAAPFKSYLFLCNGTNPVVRVSRAPVTSLGAFVGPSGADTLLCQVSTYRNRLYFVQKQSNSIWYGGVEAVTGALTEFDVSSVLESPSDIYFTTSWTVNQGDSNEDLFLIATRRGEILIYSGDWPSAANWRLIGRTFVPTILGRKAFCKLGNDLIIYTKLGPVSLSAILRSGALPSSEYEFSDKISKAYSALAISGLSGSFPSVANRAVMVRDELIPVLYVVAQAYIYVLNYKTGAWSIFTTSGSPTSICYAFGMLMIGYSASPEITYIQPILGTQSSYPTAATGTVVGASRSFSTGWLNFGSEETIKHILAIRFFNAIPATSSLSTISYTITVYSSLLPDYNSTTDVQTITVSSNTGTPIKTEFRPNAMPAAWFQIGVSSSGSDAADEFYGMDIEYETLGGAY